jgi:hypothetical protein
VTDNSGAIIPGVSVQVTNTATGVAARVQTNGEGNYLVPFLAPGPYQVTLEMPGCKTFQRDKLELRVADRLEVNITMEVGSVSENVTVTAESPLLETTSASTGFVIDVKRVAEIPLPHGVPFFLMQLSPGANFAGGALNNDRPYDSWSASYAINGSRANRSEISIDGAPASSTNFSRDIIASWVPPADAVAEFKVQTATFDASIGNTEGGAVNVSLKSGTNTLHGTAQLVKLRPELSANTFFGNRNRQPRADFSYGRWGATAGGPVRLPRLYEGRNRTSSSMATKRSTKPAPAGQL